MEVISTCPQWEKSKFPPQSGTRPETRSEIVIPQLYMDLNNKDTRIKREAIHALRNIGSKKSAAIFLNALNIQDSIVQGTSLEALGEIGDKNAVSDIISFFWSKNEYLHDCVLDALEKIGGEFTVDLLLKLLNSDKLFVGRDELFNVFFRKNVALALLRLGDKKALLSLIKIFFEDVYELPFVSLVTSIAIARLGGEEYSGDFIRLLKDDDPFFRNKAAMLLGEIGETRAVCDLILNLKCDDAVVQRSAAEALGKIGGKESVEALIKNLDDESSLMRESIVDALGKIGDRRAVKHLIKKFDDPDSGVRSAAVYAVGNIGGELAEKALLELFYNKDSDIRSMAVGALRLNNISSVETTKAIFLAIEDGRVPLCGGNLDFSHWGHVDITSIKLPCQVH